MADIIAFVGNQTAGKTTAAKILEAEHGYARTRFAGSIRNMLRALGLGDYELEGEGKNKPCALLNGKTPVHAMQTLGDWGRDQIHPDFWVGHWERDVVDVLDEGGKVAVDDLRFPNEYARLKELGAVVVRVERPGVGRQSDHNSESYTAGLAVDATLANDGSVEHLGDLLGDIK